MHFHLPKPLHGWREFLGEVGIIVIGVLIALGAERVAEAIHWSSEVEAERASLLQEGRDSFEVLQARIAQQGCVDRRLADVRKLLERHHRSLPIEIISPVGQPTRVAATRGSWQIALAGQALSHMAHDEKLHFSDAFGWFDRWDKVIEQESEIWLRLAPLNTPSLLSDRDWSGLTSAYAQAVVVNDRIRMMTPFMRTRTLPGVQAYRPAGNWSAASVLNDPVCQPLIRGRDNKEAVSTPLRSGQRL